MWVALWHALALAGVDGQHAGAHDPEPAAPPAPDPAEYARLSQELETLAAKNAWAGVERTFVELIATGVAPSFEDWFRGAQSARVRGDIGEARDRLAHAATIAASRDVVDWMWEIDHHYGKAFLACDDGSHITLAAVAMPFDPDMRRAIEFAAEQVHDRCAFEGLLPQGDYTFFGRTLHVEPLVQDLHVDLRGVAIDHKTRRALRKEWTASADGTGRSVE